MGDKLDDIIDSSVAAIVGVVLLCAAVIPISLDFIGDLTGEAAQYAPLLSVVIVMVILGLVIGVIRFFQSSKRRREVKGWQDSTSRSGSAASSPLSCV